MRKSISAFLICSLVMGSIVLAFPKDSYASEFYNEQNYRQEIVSSEVVTVIDEDTGVEYEVLIEEYFEVPVNAPYSLETVTIAENENVARGLFPEYPVGTRRGWNFTITNSELNNFSIVAGTPIPAGVKSAIANIVSQRLASFIGGSVLPGINIAGWVASVIATINGYCGNNGFYVNVEGVYSSTYIHSGGYYMYGWSLDSLSMGAF